MKNIVLICALALLCVACSQKSPVATPAPARVAAAATPAADMPVATASTEDTQLNDQFVDPDAGLPAVADEEDDAQSDADEPGVDLFADNREVGEVKLIAQDTTNIHITGRGRYFAHQVALRNDDLRAKREAPEAKADESKPAQAPTPKVEAPAPAPIDEKKILADLDGQWASGARASSTYASSSGQKAGYAPWQATGAPNVPSYSDHPNAWTTKSGDSKAPEWLELDFAKPVHATSIRVRQTAAPGVIAKIELIDASDVAHEIWSGTDDSHYEKNAVGWFVRDVPRTGYLVKGARLTLLTSRVWGWNEIDAVQLVGTIK